MRVAFLTNIVSPYRLPVFERLAQTPGWDFRVITNAASEFDRAWDVDCGELDVVQTKSLSIPRKVVCEVPIQFEQRITLHIPIGLHSDLRRFRPDVIISHELGPRTIAAAAYCKMYRIPLVIWSYQSRVSASQGGRRERLRRWLLGQASAVVGMGTQAREVLRAWGADDDVIVDALNSADVETIATRLADPATDNAAQEIRAEWGDGCRLALFVGRLIPMKGIDALINTWQGVEPGVRASWKLAVVGDGPLAPMIDDAAHLGIRRVGTVPTTQMTAWYRACDLHVFPTLGDVWGLVVNEASQCGVPSLCSIHAGCSDDLIDHGRNGFVFDPSDEAGAISRLTEVMQHPHLGAVGAEAQRDIKRCTLDGLADGFRAGVEQATQTTLRRSA